MNTELQLVILSIVALHIAALVGGGLALGIWGLLYVVLGASTPWNPYVDWLVAWSVAGFILYGLDKGLARAKGPRVPELVLNLLAVLLTLVTIYIFFPLVTGSPMGEFPGWAK